MHWPLSLQDLGISPDMQWLYAARAGSRTSTYAGTPEILGRWNSPLLETIAWYGGNSRTDFTSGFRVSCAKREGTEVPMQQCGPQPVGQKQPNAWGLHDMIGNVMQHTYDSKIAGMRIRGCSWFDEAIECRVGYPATLTYEQRQMVVGLRPARDIP
jgi:formylglycine-generating enzyme required for sulfatase activity